MSIFASAYVVPPSPISNTRVTDSTTRTVLNNCMKYYQQTWWAGKGFPNGQVPLPNDEIGIRGAAMVAYAIAVTTETGLMVPTGGTDVARARLDTARLVAACARQYGAWGGGWQSALWAWHAGLAGWLHWSTGIFTLPVDKDNIATMVETEANIQLDTPALFWKDANDVELFPGDTKLEENSWRGLLLSLAVAMMPTHPNAGLWSWAAKELAVTATAVKTDLSSPVVLSGASVADWIGGRGYNVNPDYSVVNHNKVNPDYAICVIQNLAQAFGYGLAGWPYPLAITWNAREIYGAFQGPPFVYRPGTATVFYPAGADWGNRRSSGYAAMDAAMDALGLDRGGRVAGHWRDLHEADTLAMQKRNANGALYQNTTPPEDTYGAREEWGMSQVATGHLFRMLRAAGRLVAAVE